MVEEAKRRVSAEPNVPFVVSEFQAGSQAKVTYFGPNCSRIVFENLKSEAVFITFRIDVPIDIRCVKNPTQKNIICISAKNIQTF